MNSILEILSKLLNDYIFIAPVIALLAGILTSFLPCSLPMIPIIIGYLSGNNYDKKMSFKVALAFSIGSILVFTVFGLTAAIIGKILNQFSRVFYILIGILLILMAFQNWHFIKIISLNKSSKLTKSGIFGAFIAGALQAVFASPCSTPVLVSLMAIAANTRNILLSIVLFVFYGIGNCFLVFVSALLMGKIEEIIQRDSYTRISKVIEICLGVILMSFGLYFLYQGI
ncbi:cytochrome c biogenesis CcdA family protein [uncultured Finegoldia sp.]|uniref:cytochrome c biogenesis CcdA family protein n=1 Tax=uncultured Finegoldia sp. TaxID=328009 RepID=UPI002611DF96|nr:cytochrome c biogenesis protein CcdA [uncultured Finegoldia sp.]